MNHHKINDIIIDRYIVYEYINTDSYNRLEDRFIQQQLQEEEEEEDYYHIQRDIYNNNK